MADVIIYVAAGLYAVGFAWTLWIVYRRPR